VNLLGREFLGLWAADDVRRPLSAGSVKTVATSTVRLKELLSVRAPNRLPVLRRTVPESLRMSRRCNFSDEKQQAQPAESLARDTAAPAQAELNHTSFSRDPDFRMQISHRLA
jgi:hypothetical protein